MTQISPMQVTTGVQQILLRLMGVMLERNLLSQPEVKQIFSDAATTLRNQPNELNTGAAKYIDILSAQIDKR